MVLGGHLGGSGTPWWLRVTSLAWGHLLGGSGVTSSAWGHLGGLGGHLLFLGSSWWHLGDLGVTSMAWGHLLVLGSPWWHLGVLGSPPPGARSQAGSALVGVYWGAGPNGAVPRAAVTLACGEGHHVTPVSPPGCPLRCPPPPRVPVHLQQRGHLRRREAGHRRQVLHLRGQWHPWVALGTTQGREGGRDTGCAGGVVQGDRGHPGVG